MAPPPGTHEQGGGGCVDGGPLFDSTVPRAGGRPGDEARRPLVGGPPIRPRERGCRACSSARSRPAPTPRPRATGRAQAPVVPSVSLGVSWARPKGFEPLTNGIEEPGPSLETLVLPRPEPSFAVVVGPLGSAVIRGALPRIVTNCHGCKSPFACQSRSRCSSRIRDSMQRRRDAEAQEKDADFRCLSAPLRLCASAPPR